MSEKQFFTPAPLLADLPHPPHFLISPGQWAKHSVLISQKISNIFRSNALPLQRCFPFRVQQFHRVKLPPVN
jgi:hypothetical protein